MNGIPFSQLVIRQYSVYFNIQIYRFLFVYRVTISISKFYIYLGSLLYLRQIVNYLSVDKCILLIYIFMRIYVFMNLHIFAIPDAEILSKYINTIYFIE